MTGLGLALCVFAIWIVVNGIGKVRFAWRLSDGIKVAGEIVTADEQIEDCDSCPGRVRHTYDVIYRFRTKDGQPYRNYVNVGYKPESDTVDVTYNPANPLESRLADAGETTVGGAIGLLVIFTGVAAAIATIGVSIILDTWEKKNH
jgi:hypothetical protein